MKNKSTESIREFLNSMSKEELDNLFSTTTETTNTKPKKKKQKQPSWTITWKHIQSR